MTTPIEAQLDELLRSYSQALIRKAIEQQGGTIVEFAERSKTIRQQSVTKLLDLIAHLASEAKPEKQNIEKLSTYNSYKAMQRYKDIGHNEAIDTYEANLLRALGRET